MNIENTYIWFCLLIINYGLIALSFKYFKKEGLFIWIVFSSIVANIQVMKTVELFGFVTTLGNIVYGTSFLATDILSECYGKKEAQRGVWMGVFGLVATTIVMQFCLLFVPHESDQSHAALTQIFSILPRITIASITAYIVSQHFDVWFYNYLREKFPKHLWLRNNFSTISSQMLDTVIFTLLAFYGVFETDIIWQIFFSTYILKWLVALFDTPVIYWAKRYHKQQ